MMKLSDEKISHIKEVYAETKSSKKTAQTCGVSQNSVIKYAQNKIHPSTALYNLIILNDYGLDGRRKLSDADIRYLKYLRKNTDITLKDLAKNFDVSVFTVRRWLDDEFRHKANKLSADSHKRRGDKPNKETYIRLYRKRREIYIKLKAKQGESNEKM